MNCIGQRNLTWFESCCRFHERLARCQRQEFSVPLTRATESASMRKQFAWFRSFLDERFASALKLLKFYTVTFAKPPLCLATILLSIVDMRIILTDPNMLINTKSSKMYYYIFAAAIVDIIVAVTYLTDLLNECIQPHGMLCAEFRKNMQYFKVIEFLIHFILTYFN